MPGLDTDRYMFDKYPHIGRSAPPAGGRDGGCHTATSGMRLAAAVAAARLLRVQLAAKLPTGCRW
jgi:hypothetical protein